MAISEQVSRLQQAKMAIKTAIIQKGVEVPESAKIDTFNSYIQQIETGGGEPILQEKTVIPTASGMTVTPDSDYDGLSSVTVTGDNNLTPINIKKGTTIFGVEGTYDGGGSVVTEGFLPMPVTNMTFAQEKYTRGKGTVKFIFPQDTTSVDVLIKENELPSNTEDYDQKVTTESGEAEVIFNKHEDGTYANKYGIWAISNNDSGTQTALSRSNRSLYDFLYSSGDVSESQVAGLSLELDYSYWGCYEGSYKVYKSFACKKLGDHLLFNQGRPKSSVYKYGLFDLNLKTNELKCITTSNCLGIIQTFNSTPVDNKYLIMPSVNTRLLLYDSLNGTITDIGSGNTNFNTGIQLDNNTVMCISGYNSAPKMLFKFADNTLKTLAVTGDSNQGWLQNCQVVKTTQGIFAITKWDTSSSTNSFYNFCYKYNETTESFDKVHFNTESGYLVPLYKSQLYETADGVIFISYENANWIVHRYDGEKFVDTNTGVHFYDRPIFSIGSHECYVNAGKIYEFVGTTIQKFGDFGDTNERTFVKVFSYSNGNYLLLTSHGSFLINGETKAITKLSDINDLESDAASYYLFVEDVVYFSSINTSYAVSNDGTITTLFSGTTQTDIVQRYQKVGEKIIAFRYTGTSWSPVVLEDGVFISQGTQCATELSYYVLPKAYKRGNYIYFVYSYTQNYKSSTSWQQWDSSDDLYVYRYDVQNKTSEKLEGRKISLHLGGGNYWSASDKKIYNFENDISDNVSFEIVNLFSNGLDSSNDENLWSNYSLALNVTKTSISALYVN